MLTNEMRLTPAMLLGVRLIVSVIVKVLSSGLFVKPVGPADCDVALLSRNRLKPVRPVGAALGAFAENASAAVTCLLVVLEEVVPFNVNDPLPNVAVEGSSVVTVYWNDMLASAVLPLAREKAGPLLAPTSSKLTRALPAATPCR